MIKLWKKIKNFIKGNKILHRTVLFFWSILCIIRANLIFKRIKHDLPKGNCKIIIPTIRTIAVSSWLYFDAVFGHAFKRLGCDVKLLSCDGVLGSCDVDTAFKDQKNQCFSCKTLGSLVKNSLNLDWISYKQYISDSEIEEIKRIVSDMEIEELMDYKYFGVKVSEHARASTIRFYLSGQFDLSNPEVIATFRKKVIYAMIATKVANEIYLKEKPEMIFIMHGIYSGLGPFFDYFREKGVEVIVYGQVVFRFGSFFFNRNNRRYKLASKEIWNNFSQRSLSKEEESQIDAYMSTRLKGAADDHSLCAVNFDKSSKDRSLLIPHDKRYLRRYVLYPNLAWDACVESRGSIIFKDIFAWLDTTIDYFQKKTDYQLIIKPHPFELVEKNTKGITDYIYKKHPNLPENIVVLKANIPLRAYDLIAPGDICITFNGTIGMEVATQGVPVLVAGSSHYKDAGIAHRIKTVEEYLNLLDNPEKLISFARANIKLAKKYTYFYYIMLTIRVPVYRDDKLSTVNWKNVWRIEKLLSDNSQIMKICQKIINKEDIINPFN